MPRSDTANIAAARRIVEWRNSAAGTGWHGAFAPAMEPDTAGLCYCRARYFVALGRPGLREPIVSTLLIVVLILVLLAVTPRWSYSARWGYGPSGIVGIVLIVIIVLALLGRI